MKKLIFLFALLFFVNVTGFSPNNSSGNNVVVIPNESVVFITKTGSKYHKSSCHHLKKSKIEIEKSKAKELGYTACSVCKP